MLDFLRLQFNLLVTCMHITHSFFCELSQAIMKGHKNTVEEWLQKNPEVNRCRGGKSVVSKLDSSNTKLEFSGGTALHWAAFYGRVEIAKLLLESQASMCTAEHCRSRWCSYLDSDNQGSIFWSWIPLKGMHIDDNGLVTYRLLAYQSLAVFSSLPRSYFLRTSDISYFFTWTN